MKNNGGAYTLYMTKKAATWRTFVDPTGMFFPSRITPGDKAIPMPVGLRRGVNFPKAMKDYNRLRQVVMDSPAATAAERGRSAVTKHVSDGGFWGAQAKADALASAARNSKEKTLAAKLYGLKKKPWRGLSPIQNMKHDAFENKMQTVRQETEKRTPQGFWRRNKNWLLPAGAGIAGIGGLGLLAWMLSGSGGTKGNTVNNYYNGPPRKRWNDSSNWRGTNYRTKGGGGY